MGYALYNRIGVLYCVLFFVYAFGILGKGVWGGTPDIKDGKRMGRI
jgi:hypothetical protein